MNLFPTGHATHPQWPMAAALALAQVRAQMGQPGHAPAPRLGLLYITDHYASQAQEILDHLRAELPQVSDWAGTVGVGIAASGVEYFDEPALALMLCDLPREQYAVFSGVAPLGPRFAAASALVHADGHTPDLADLISELADRTASGWLFGGLAASRGEAVQFAWSAAGRPAGAEGPQGVFRGGLSGVAFGPGVALLSRVTQGCDPIAGEHVITQADGNLVLALDGQPALDVLLQELRALADEPQKALSALRHTLAGLRAPAHEGGALRQAGREGRARRFGADVVVRHLIGIDPRRRGVALADRVEAGMRLAFCRRDVQAARTDLVRICAEVRDETEPQELSLPAAVLRAAQDPLAGPDPAGGIAGAIYVSCAGRGGPHFGGPSEELRIVRRALGDVPLVGFFAGGEIAGHQLYGYTGVLTVFR